MPTATRTRDLPVEESISSATGFPDEETFEGEDGFPIKMWNVNGEPVAFSLRPYELSERKIYWNPQGPDAPMWWRAQTRNKWGLQPIIQREVWIDGKFSPRNDWEDHMTQEWLRAIPGGSPEKWTGYDHPENVPGQPPHHWRCGDCKWLCGNWAAFKQHQAQLCHKNVISE